jgi:hypothetical protein
MYDVDQLRRDAFGRRAFLARMSAAGLGAAAIAFLDGCGGSSSSTGPTKNVPDPTNFPNITGHNENQAVLNYALTLETLEANLYLQALNAASGNANLNAPLNATFPTASNPLGAYTLAVGPGSINSSLVQPAFAYLVQFAYVEAAHRDFLKSLLGNVAAPIVPASGNYKFATSTGKPGSDLGTILSSILPLEETGVRAYLGAGKFITDNSTFEVAGSIYSTECRHSASIEVILGQDPGPKPASSIPGVPSPDQEVQPPPNGAENVFEKYLTPTVVLNAASSAYFA